MGVGGEAALPGALDSAHPTLVPRYLEGQAAVTIQHVACGDLFTACLTGELAPFSPPHPPTTCLGSYPTVSQILKPN